MTRDEYLAHDAELAAAAALTEAERRSLNAARARRNETRDAWDQACAAWANAESTKYQAAGRNDDKAYRRLAELDAARDAARGEHEAACRSLGMVEGEIDASRGARVRRVETAWQALVDERTSQTIAASMAVTHVRIFDSPEERDAAYAGRRT